MAEAVLVAMWLGITLYAVFGSADFGAGVWDLLAGSAERGSPRRAVIEHSIGPVWEANHVWLIFVLVFLWTGFPRAFAPLASTMLIPLTAAALGIILRGSGFAFRKTMTTVPLQRLFGATFAASSLLTPFFLGAIAGGVASGRIPAAGAGDLVGSWWNPTSMLGGVLAVTSCAFLAASFLAADSVRSGMDAEAEWFRERALVVGILAGLIAMSGIVVLRSDAPTLFHGLTSRGLPLIVASGVAGSGSLVLLWNRRYHSARVAVVIAVVTVVWGWAAGQYPWLLVDALEISAGSGSLATQRAMLISLGVGAVLFVPPLIYLLMLNERGKLRGSP
ncbi:MAG: cytochrome D ubiquinol oxidase subunit II [Actinobacteria bacterium RBG_16_68_21]|nr:MAG: cytochrome D ubiquinol oxidase subunit II [Actinobacteria bacterium RBG_16_68_21]